MSPAHPTPGSSPTTARRTQGIEKKTRIAGDTAASEAMSAMAADEAADLAAAQTGDDDAFARIYDRLAPVVLSLCRKRSLAEAEDATQETFIRAHRLLHKVSSIEKLRPWLFGIARRVCSERTRSARRRSRHEEGFGLSRPETATAEAAPLSEHAEQLQRLGAALEQLDDRERLAIHLHYLEADPVNVASSALGLSRSGYYKLLARAREQLAALMESEVNPS